MKARPSGIKAVISDLDGVTYRGSVPIDGAVKAFQSWHRRGVPYAFVTNNSTMTAGEFATKLRGMGIPADEQSVITTSSATAAIVSRKHRPGTKVYVIGSDALRCAIAGAGFVISEADAEVVVAGLDRSFDFARLSLAQRIILSGGDFYGTNPDRILPNGSGFEPGAGSILAAIEAASGIAPIIVGKPQPTLVELALERLGTPREQTLMIGDQITTDVAAGAAAGLKTLLVKTGVPESGPRELEPDFECDDLADIADEIG